MKTMSREKNKKSAPLVTEADSRTQKNIMLMRLLTLVPEFQKDVRTMRKQCGIKESGLDSEKDAYEWLNKNKFNFYDDMPTGFYQEPRKSNIFKEKVFELGEKFNLPYHFYNSAVIGVGYHILTDYIRVPATNWIIDSEFRKEGGAPRWVGIKAYAPLSNKEIGEATTELRRMQRRLMDKQITRSTRIHPRFWRYLKVVGAWSSKRGRPQKIKRYRNIFLQRAAEQGRNMRELEWQWKQEGVKNPYEFRPDRVTSIATAKGNKRKANAYRQTVIRLNKLAKELFGYGIDM
jgi:hypothetical protein